jgi:AcrR family transcriptional regulator
MHACQDRSVHGGTFFQSDCNDAVILHLVDDIVNAPDLRAARKADTESRVLRAASDLFVAQGYATTTLTQVAGAAGVAARTVYVRFGTKAALLARAVGVALVGDTAPIPVADRDWSHRALTAPTAAERIEISARGTRELFERAGPLLVVATQAEATEPAIAAAAQAGRVETRQQIRAFWQAMSDDGLLPDGADVDWLADTGTLLGSADTYVQMTRVIGWDPEAYEQWLRVTLTRLLEASATV